MAANPSEIIQIEDLGNHSRQAVADLRCLLVRGASKVADPKRHNFYEIESDSLIYYIHESPLTGKILLLATWQNQNVPVGGAA